MSGGTGQSGGDDRLVLARSLGQIQGLVGRQKGVVHVHHGQAQRLLHADGVFDLDFTISSALWRRWPL